MIHVKDWRKLIGRGIAVWDKKRLTACKYKCVSVGLITENDALLPVSLVLTCKGKKLESYDIFDCYLTRGECFKDNICRERLAIRNELSLVHLQRVKLESDLMECIIKQKELTDRHLDMSEMERSFDDKLSLRRGSYEARKYFRKNKRKRK